MLSFFTEPLTHGEHLASDLKEIVNASVSSYSYDSRSKWGRRYDKNHSRKAGHTAQSSTQLMFHPVWAPQKRGGGALTYSLLLVYRTKCHWEQTRTEPDRSSGHQHAKEESSVLLSSSRRLKLLMNLTPKFWFV